METYSAADTEVIELLSEAEKERMALDPIYRLENEERDKRKAREDALRITHLEDLQRRDRDDYANNSLLRKIARVCPQPFEYMRETKL